MIMLKASHIATEISQTLPTLLRHMYPYVFQPMELPPSQVIAIISIEENPGCNLTILRKEMHVTAPTITGIIDRLERDDYVRREEDKNDRRVTKVFLTVKGKKVAVKFREKIKTRWEYILSKMPGDVGGTVLGVMKRITKGFTDGTM